MAKRKKKIKEPSLGFMLFTGFSGIFLGTLAAVVMLLSNPAELAKGTDGQAVDKLGDYTVSYQPGYTLGTETTAFKSRMTRFKRKLPGSLVFDEGEVNHFLSQFRSAPAGEEEGEKKQNVEMGSPNLRFTDENMVLSSVIVINPNTKPFKLTLQSEIDFEATESGPQVTVGKTYLNSLPVPGFVSNMLIGKIMGAATLPEDLTSAWEAVKEIRLEDRKFVVTL